MNAVRKFKPAPFVSLSGKGKRDEPEILWTFAPRVEPGQYQAFSRSAGIYWDGGFKRWVCAVQFDVLDGSLTEVKARLTWYLNLGSREKPHAGMRTNYRAAWAKANNGPPKRGDRLSPRLFKGRHAVVLVEGTAKNHKQIAIGADESYSVIRDVVRWETGGSIR